MRAHDRSTVRRLIGFLRSRQVSAASRAEFMVPNHNSLESQLEFRFASIIWIAAEPVRQLPTGRLRHILPPSFGPPLRDALDLCDFLGGGSDGEEQTRSVAARGSGLARAGASWGL